VLDPEVHDGFDYLVYQRKNGAAQEARIMRLNPTTGAPNLSTDGVIASDVASYADSQAGPKFSNGLNNSVAENFIAYTKDVSTLDAAGIRKRNPQATGCTDSLQSPTKCFPPDPAWVGQIPYPDPQDTDEQRKIVYTTEEEDLPFRAQAVYHYGPTTSLAWAVLNNTLNQQTVTETIYANDTTPLQWARMEKMSHGGTTPPSLMIVSSWQPTGSSYKQVFLIDTVSAVATQITSNTSVGDKFNPFLFQDKTTGHNMIVYRESPSMFFSNIVILEETTLDSGSWQLYLKITAEDLGEWAQGQGGRRYLLSPEPFHVGNVSYILFSSSNTQNVSQQTDGNIWIARVDTTLHSVRVNDRPTGAEVRPRVEGEVYFAGNGPVFFYSWQVVQQNDPPGSLDCNLNPLFLNNYVLASVSGVVLP
jgi:hypothetical protein